MTVTRDSLNKATQSSSVCADKLPYTWLGHVFNGASTIINDAATTESYALSLHDALPIYSLNKATQTSSVCADKLPYTWLGHVFNGASTIIDTVSSPSGCDTIRTLTVTVDSLNKATQTSDRKSDKQGKRVDVGGRSSVTTKIDTVSSTSGCDTIRTLTVTVVSLNNATQTSSVCADKLPYTWLGHVFNGASTIIDTVSSPSGCDTIRTLTVTVDSLNKATQT